MPRTTSHPQRFLRSAAQKLSHLALVEPTEGKELVADSLEEEIELPGGDKPPRSPQQTPEEPVGREALELRQLRDLPPRPGQVIWRAGLAAGRASAFVACGRSVRLLARLNAVSRTR